MTFHDFRFLSPAMQFYLVFKHGTYLIQHWEGLSLVNLYHLYDRRRGFFAEVSINDAQDYFSVLRSFRSAEPLENYVVYVRLAEL